MARPWLAPALRSASAFVLGIGAAFVLASHLTERFLVAEAAADLRRIETGASRISFEFDSLRDLISEGAVGAADAAIADGVLQARLPDGRANVRMNLRGLTLDAKRFARLELRVEASQASELVLIFDEPAQLEEWSHALSLQPGWNDIGLNLSELAWLRSADRASQRAADAQVWGGASGRVGELRLYLSGPQQLRVGLDHLRFLESDAEGASDKIEWVSADEARVRLARPGPLARSPAKRIGVLLPVWRARPEVLLSLRDRVRANDAESLFWPAGRAVPGAGNTTATALTGWTLPGWLIGLYALILVLARWRLRTSSRSQAAIDLTLGLGPLVALTVGLGLGERPSPSALALLLIALGYMYSRVELRGLDWRGSALAWRHALLLTAAIGLGIGLAALMAGQLPRPDIERALLYLPFVVLQQLLLLGFLLPRARILLPSAPAALAAVLFALPHAPNFALLVGSGFTAWIWARLFLRYRAPLPILVSHYLLGLLAVFCLPSEFLYSAESSLRFFVVR